MFAYPSISFWMSLNIVIFPSRSCLRLKANKPWSSSLRISLLNWLRLLWIMLIQIIVSEYSEANMRKMRDPMMAKGLDNWFFGIVWIVIIDFSIDGVCEIEISQGFAKNHISGPQAGRLVRRPLQPTNGRASSFDQAPS